LHIYGQLPQVIYIPNGHGNARVPNKHYLIFTSYSDEIFKSEIGDNRKSVLNQSRYKSRQDAEFETKNK